jgi:AcrR family transcriptional regulator
VLSPELIVETALEVADREGLEALSMRRVGSELGVAAMSLYSHVANKDELLDRLADHVIGTIAETESALAWQDAMVEFFTALHDALVAHPAAAQVVIQRPTVGPNTQRLGAHALEILTRGGLSDRVAVDAFIALSRYTMGAAIYTTTRTGARADDPRFAGLGAPTDDEPEAVTRLRPFLAQRSSRDQFRSGLEHLVRGYASEASPRT